MTDKPVADLSFEEAMAALESVVSQLERGEVADGEIIEHGCPPGGWGECH